MTNKKFFGIIKLTNLRSEEALLAVIAGVMIAIGAIVNLKIGGLIGAILFSIGLVTVCYFHLYLYTGKAGLLIDGKITFWNLFKIFCGNWIGASFVGLLCSYTELAPIAAEIVDSRLENGFLLNVGLGILCGILVYIAVTAWMDAPWITILAVTTFVAAGFAHSIADIFYFYCAGNSNNVLPILEVAIGNLIGCNIIPAYQRGSPFAAQSPQK